MNNWNKDYKLISITSILTTLSVLFLYNIKDMLHNSAVWQFALIGLGGIIVTTLVNIFTLSQKLQDKKALLQAKA